LEHDAVEKWIVDGFLLQLSGSCEEIFVFCFISLSQPHFLELLLSNEYEGHAELYAVGDK
jgi:hypothetical protein